VFAKNARQRRFYVLRVLLTRKRIAKKSCQPVKVAQLEDGEECVVPVASVDIAA
jgi:hypothetical protein